ncbi:membrane protein insertase YidC [Aquibacillus salsiterrae]|uniref:Membrane protein insertase YidC n=1 Tax=Aquibacillus salsiterrae TaxID=2950439 RepID=A0A9X3WGN7_9BACI|nr:membrane protein insertase YidC [Aquibacillus salsiterrae]MDC3417094.1 membrane protein insertase YidC [Aquibacillus salsiterrae]
MVKTFVFTKKTNLILISILLVLLMTGCQAASNDPISNETSGFFNHYFVYTFSIIIKQVASFFGGNFGISIIVVTLLIRLLLFPLMMKQSKQSFQAREKMQVIKPEMEELQARYKDKKDADSQKKMQQEMMQLYQRHQFNPLTSMGCLPMIIQFPILIGFYYAIRRTPEIATHSFLWFDLGQTDIVMPLVAAIIYFIQFKVTQIGMDEKQRKQMAIMGLLSPVMIGLFSFSAPAALPLYWTIGGTFLIIQQILFKKMYQPKQS